MGKIVQINSIVWFWSSKRLVSLLNVKDSKMHRISKVMKIKIIIVKSWKKIIKSQIGELEFCKFINQVLIFNKSSILYWRILNPLHLSAILKNRRNFVKSMI